MRLHPVFCVFFSAFSCALAPVVAHAQPAIHHMPFTASGAGQPTDYAYLWSPDHDAIAVDFYNRLEIFDASKLGTLVDLGPPRVGAWGLLGWEPNHQALLLRRLPQRGEAPREDAVVTYDMAQENFSAPLPHSGAMQLGSWSPDGRSIALTGVTSGVRVYDAVSHVLLFEFARAGRTGEKLVWSPDGRTIAAVRTMPDYSETVFVADVPSRQVVAKVPLASGPEQVLAFSPDGAHLLVGSDAGQGVHLVGRDGKTTAMARYPSYIMDAAWSPTGEFFAVSTVGDGVFVADACAQTQSHLEHAAPAPSIAWAPSHDTLAVAGDNLQLLHMPKKNVVWSTPGGVDKLAWSADGTYLAWSHGGTGVSLIAMGSIGQQLRAESPVAPWDVPNTQKVSQLAWSKARLQLHLASVEGLTTVDLGALDPVAADAP